MIAYDLECDNGHPFEGWFDNAKSFVKQQKKGLVTCPVCQSSGVTRLLSTFGIAKYSGREEKPPSAPPIEHFEKLQKFVQDNFEDVGSDFAKEALKMHYGVEEYRNIRGVSSEKEEETLKDEGVPFFKVPTPSPPGPDEE